MASKKAIFRMHRDKSKATTKPVRSVDQLKGLWDRDFGVYRVVVVDVYDLKGSVLSFDIILDPSTAARPKKGARRAADARYTIDLDDGANVWGDLPSTAQLYEKGGPSIAYLCLNENWLYENVDEAGVYAGPGGGVPKIPRSLSL